MKASLKTLLDNFAEVNYSFDDELLIYGDYDRLKQVFINILKNSVEAKSKNIDIDINMGEKIGIIGQVGSGKTTLMNIISGFLEVSNNKLFINDVDINEYSRRCHI